ncbi:hypothetical protein CC1G_07708 [Coprinopsis cinerea okayama7|uniref:Uncharacterized protein n=1 Tax=Coprinopsis cinerea (strain Okayama-7 / 130 / ATCC MYA-4618 / FGSC 9003) TaxID=240176 RepID=A8NBW1_COPC7|nr:hypothetical protein CC1G_07708 [Coprinopsis cinerea okayama7\|eukprot:XP_001832321.2 hypothetical protein CC1G_07708 [Coprinopsis cinerea okayama7\
MSISDLEHLALSPQRFICYMRRNENSVVSPSRTQIFLPKNPFNPNERLVISQLYLLPGGRFLITNTTSCGLCLWDLGINAGHTPRGRPMAFISLASPVFLEEPNPTADGRGILLFCNSTIAQTPRQFVIYEIYPTADIPAFVQKADLRVGDTDVWNPEAHSCAMLGNYIVFETSLENDPERYLLNVWDWVDDTGCKWETKGGATFAMVENTLMALVCLADSNEYQFAVYDLPAMQPLVDGWNVVSCVNHPQLLLNRRHSSCVDYGIHEARSWSIPRPYVCLLDGGNLLFDPEDTEPTVAQSLHAELYMVARITSLGPAGTGTYQGSRQVPSSGVRRGTFSSNRGYTWTLNGRSE